MVPTYGLPSQPKAGSKIPDLIPFHPFYLHLFPAYPLVGVCGRGWGGQRNIQFLLHVIVQDCEKSGRDLPGKLGRPPLLAQSREQLILAPDPILKRAG